MMAIMTTFIGQASTRHRYDWSGQNSGRTDRENVDILTHLLRLRILLDTRIVAAGKTEIIKLEAFKCNNFELN